MSVRQAQEPLRVLSLGAGVQSTTLLLMALDGEFEHRLDAAIFADTQWEPRAVYEHLEYLRTLCDRARLPLITVTGGNIREKTVNEARGKGDAFPGLPFHVDGKGLLRRQCTTDYKVRPIHRGIRALLTEYDRERCELWMGISADEWKRMKESRVRYIVHRFPLIDRAMRRADCLDWMTAHGYATPPKSACIGCPYHADHLWRAMKLTDPESWNDAVEFDYAIRQLPRITGSAYLHGSLKPLDEVDLRNAEDHGQTSLWDNECEGMCGV